MELKEFYKKQAELDQFIVDKKFNSKVSELARVSGNNPCFLSDRLFALQVEVSELANATRCFKYWSDKGAEPKERLLDEYSDILHFFLSVGNTLEFTVEEIEEAYHKKYQENIRRQQNGY